MKTAIFLTRIKSTREAMRQNAERFLLEINSHLEGFQLESAPQEDLDKEPFRLVLIGSGGAAADFKEYFQKSQGPYILISSFTNNSLPACMEILSYINDHGEKGEILYGSTEEIAAKLTLVKKAFDTKGKLASFRFGILGTPNILINSEADKEVLKATFGIDSVELTMDEVFREIAKKEYVPTEATERLLSLHDDRKAMLDSLYVYGAVKRLVERYDLQGVALRCFDLLEPIGTSGCIALALLNAEGIYAACEGDTRSLLSMAVLGELSSSSTFMANPSKLDQTKSSMVFAHCTLPLDMPDSFTLPTHFESGLSIAVKGNFSGGTFTLFKCRENGKDYFVQKGEFLSSPDDPLLCRTQLELKVEDWKSYLTRPLSNHQVIVKGDWRKEVEEFFHWL